MPCDECPQGAEGGSIQRWENVKSKKKHEGIERLCEIIGELPDTKSRGRREALYFAAGAVGVQQERTALPWNVDRPIGHLYWDHEVSDLREGLVRLVEDNGVSEELIVTGMETFLERHFLRFATHESVVEEERYYSGMIESFEAQKGLPLNERKEGATDERIDDFLKTCHEAMGSLHKNREAAEATLAVLRRLNAAKFPPGFWRVFALEGLKDILPPGERP